MIMPGISNPRVLVIIPAYNEEKSIARVIRNIQDTCSEVDIAVINDGSSDGTSRQARSTGACVIDLPVNLGIGGAMQTGYKYAWRNGYDVAVQIDGDGQHDPKDLSSMLDVLTKEKADMVIGSRFVANTGYRPSAGRQAGIKLFSYLISKILKQPVKDTTSGYRAVNRRVIGLFARDYPTDYPEVEVLVLLHRHRLCVKEVPAHMHYRTTGASSITPWRSLYYMIKVTLSILIMLTRPQKTGAALYDL